MELYGGIDLHSRNHWLAVINEEDRRIFKKKSKSTKQGRNYTQQSSNIQRKIFWNQK